MSEETCSNGWVKLYHPRGPLVTLPVSAADTDYAAMLANVTKALDAGFLPWAPGLENGESRLEITSVVRMSKQNRDQSESPMIALYEHGNAFKSLLVYLDTEEQVLAFLYASGLKSLTDAPLLDGTTAPERGKSRSADAKILTLPLPMGVVIAPNPKYDATRAAAATQAAPYTVPKIVFVRWVDAKFPAESGADVPHTVKDEPPTDEQILATWKTFLKSDPSIADLNARIAESIPGMKEELKKQAWSVIREHAKQANLAWSKEERKYGPAMHAK